MRVYLLKRGHAIRIRYTIVDSGLFQDVIEFNAARTFRQFLQVVDVDILYKQRTMPNDYGPLNA